MVKVRMPLFSMSASGGFGDGLVFQGGVTGVRVCKRVGPGRREAGGQSAVRASYSSAASAWWGLHVHEREFYCFLGSQVSMSGFSYYMGRTLGGVSQ